MDPSLLELQHVGQLARRKKHPVVIQRRGSVAWARDLLWYRLGVGEIHSRGAEIVDEGDIEKEFIFNRFVEV
jgi:hypothetical protein